MLEQIEKFFCAINDNTEAYITSSVIQSLATLHPNLKDCNIDEYAIKYKSKTNEFLEYLLKVQDISEKSMLKILQALSSDSKYYKLPEYQEIHKHIYHTMLIKYPKVKILLDKILKILALQYNFPSETGKIILIKEIYSKSNTDLNALSLYRILLEYLFKYSETSLEEIGEYLYKSISSKETLEEIVRDNYFFIGVLKGHVSIENAFKDTTIIKIKRDIFYSLLYSITNYDRPNTLYRNILYFKYWGYFRSSGVNHKEDIDDKVVDILIKMDTTNLESIIIQTIKEQFAYIKCLNF